MIKKILLLIVVLSAPSAAVGPKYMGQADPGKNREWSAIYQEVLNIYNDLGATTNGRFVASASTSTTTSTAATTSTFQIVMSTAITPSTGKDKVIITVSGALTNSNVKDDDVGSASLFRDSTELTVAATTAHGQAQIEGGLAIASGRLTVPCTLTYVDIPGDTNSHTYSLKIASPDGSTTTWNLLSGYSFLHVEVFTP